MHTYPSKQPVLPDLHPPVLLYGPEVEAWLTDDLEDL